MPAGTLRQRVKCLFRSSSTRRREIPLQATKHTAVHMWDTKIKTICLPEDRGVDRELIQCMVWSQPMHDILSWLVLISFAQNLCRGPAVRFWLKGLSVHSGLTQYMELDDLHTRRRQPQRISLWVANNQLVFNFQFLLYMYFFPLKQTLIWHHDILKHSASWYGISPTQPCNRSRQLKHQPGTHFSISLLCLLSSYSSSVDIQWR